MWPSIKKKPNAKKGSSEKKLREKLSKTEVSLKNNRKYNRIHQNLYFITSEADNIIIKNYI